MLLHLQPVTMSGPYDYSMSIPPLDHFDPSYSMYDPRYGGYQRPSGPTTPHDGFAFWYRPPDTQESIYGGDPSVFSRGISLQSVTMHQDTSAKLDSLNIKHRRTRSGCFTCRARRVKVRHPILSIAILTKLSAMRRDRFVTVSSFCSN